MIDLDELDRLANAAPSGQWEVWTSNSWRRVYADQGREKVRVIEPCSHPMDSHPDLMFGPGVAAWLEGFTPDVARDLIAEVRRLRAQQYELMGVVADVEVGRGFDDICLKTIKRVIGVLGGVA